MMKRVRLARSGQEALLLDPTFDPLKQHAITMPDGRCAIIEIEILQPMPIAIDRHIRDSMIAQCAILLKDLS